MTNSLSLSALNLRPGFPDVLESETDDIIGGDDGPRLIERRLDLEIRGDSGSDASVEELGHHAGYYRLEHTHAARLFYFFFESRGKSSDPVVLWLTGGPGCSSELAVFYENGPFSIADNLSLVWNNYGWDKASNLIYVDQPTGTGFSYSKDVRDLRFGEKGVSDDLYDFLQGFAIGNGMTDPAIQYKAYADYAVEMGIITKTSGNIINKIFPVCELGIKRCGSNGILACLASYIVCNSIFTSILALTDNVNYYDIRKKCEGTLCYDFSNMDKFLNQQSVRTALGVGDRKFVSCSPLVYEAMITDWMKNLEVGIPALVDDGIKVLIYAGEYDLICNWLGNYRWVNSMKWSGQKMFVAAPMDPFTVDGEEAGLLKTYGPLNFLKVI
ncbi:Serine carboxypeptidase-like [Acorus calamus]|uniref:Serine carboxypeptidase-like n=1 Tax=Acorus calamus TaxID=4465 RepID=A0AAV9F6X4_ACOCL|nr:Serine carboxypeptidase-like [Acorus calamus]